MNEGIYEISSPSLTYYIFFLTMQLKFEKIYILYSFIIKEITYYILVLLVQNFLHKFIIYPCTGAVLDAWGP